MEEAERSLLGLGIRGHAAADPSGDRRPLLREVPRGVPRHALSRPRAGRRRARPVERPRLLREGQVPTPSGAARPRPARGRAAAGHPGAAAASRRRALYGGRSRQHRVRASRARARRQRPARVVPTARPQARRGTRGEAAVRLRAGPRRGGLPRGDQRGADGARSGRLHAARAALRRLPARQDVSRPQERAAAGLPRAEIETAPRELSRRRRAGSPSRPAPARAAGGREPVSRDLGPPGRRAAGTRECASLARVGAAPEARHPGPSRLSPRCACNPLDPGPQAPARAVPLPAHCAAASARNGCALDETERPRAPARLRRDAQAGRRRGPDRSPAGACCGPIARPRRSADTRSWLAPE